MWQASSQLAAQQVVARIEGELVSTLLKGSKRTWSGALAMGTATTWRAFSRRMGWLKVAPSTVQLTSVLSANTGMPFSASTCRCSISKTPCCFSPRHG